MSVRIALAQLNFLVGDIEGNCQKILDAATEAEKSLKADILVFSELALTGYPPEDLLYRSELYERIDVALEKIIEHSHDVFLVVGYPRQLNDQLYNAAAVIQNGKITHYYHKSELPNYGVFDEYRYFNADDDSATVFELNGIKFGLSICEDIWQQEPIALAKKAGAEVILNLNASPYVFDKQQQREQRISDQAIKHGVDIVYVNQVGGQDEVVFDGGSFSVNSKGHIVQRSAFFKENLSVIDFHSAKQINEIENTSLALDESIYQALVLGTQDYVKKNGFKGVVLGLSGGIDSALTLAIAVDALGAENVEGVSMPSKYTADMSNEDAFKQAKLMGVKCISIPIAPAFDAFLDMLEDEFSGLESDVTEENMQARCRGVLLMAISNKHGKMLLTTGNKSEMAVGYATLYGDMNGGFAPLKDVPKTLVYKLSNWRNRDGETIPQRVIDRPPSAELRPEQQDSDSLPDYDILDGILELYVEQDKSRSEILAAGYLVEDVDRVLRLVDISEYKRRQSPPGIKITARAFGRDRRYPITRKIP